MAAAKRKSLFDEGDDDDDDAGDASTLKVNDAYASRYENWRKLEERQKLLARYDGREGDGSSSSSSTDEEEDDDAEFDTPEVDKGFLRALSALKSKDPRIYDKSANFAVEVRPNSEDGGQKKKEKKGKPMFLRDYDRHIILEKGGKYSDEDDESDGGGDDAESGKRPVASKTYVKEQEEIKEGFKNVLQESDEEEEEANGFLKVREKTRAEKEQEDADYRRWLRGSERGDDDVDLDDKDLAKDLSGLKKVWNDSSLPEDEKFLRDYLLNQRYREKDDDAFPTYDEIVGDAADLSEDEEIVEQQELFEHKYNFRFEEPDPDFIKSYPRTLKDTVRKKDTRRRDKREEVKARKEREKAEKREELNRLKELKREEIVERLKKIREVSGNDRLGLEDRDLEEDFDPEAHDRRMAALYGDEYYGDGGGDDDDDDGGLDKSGKPVFEYDEEIDGDMPDWDNWNPVGNGEDVDGDVDEAAHDGEGTGKKKKKKKKKAETGAEASGSQENEDFVMDCDYDPSSEAYRAAMAASRKKGKRKKKSVFAKAVERKKPLFDPLEKEFEEYFDEYYQLDFEDLIGDLPTRFKYRKVVPNDFGLSTEEILAADDRDLNRWVSLKKAVQYRREEEERYDVHGYKKRAENQALKMKLLPSVYNPPPDEEGGRGKKRKNKKKKGENHGQDVAEAEADAGETSTVDDQQEEGFAAEENPNVEEAAPLPPKKKKKRRRDEDSSALEGPETSSCAPENAEARTSEPSSPKKKKKAKKVNPEAAAAPSTETKNSDGADVAAGRDERSQPVFPKQRKLKLKSQLRKTFSKAGNCGVFKKKTTENAGPKISDERLKAFGLNPKKLRNKWKYKAKDQQRQD